MKKIKYSILFSLLIFYFTVNLRSENYVPPVLDIAIDKKIIVVIDPGHGGGDWGVTIAGYYEKDINLKIAKSIKKKLEKENDIIVFLTREEDDFYKVDDRAGFANNKNADIFISIHCDYAQANVSGYKIYIQKRKNVNNNSINMLKNWKNIQQEYIDKSKKLATYIEQYLSAALIPEDSALTGNENDDVLPFNDRGQKEINSIILESINCPAILVEIGNMNNKEDFAFLKNDKYINKIAYHITEGIKNYIKDEIINNKYDLKNKGDIE